MWGASFEVNAGEIVTLFGSNGAGKTTSLRAVSGLRPPARGEIYFNGERIDRLPPYAIVERGIAQIPEGRRLWHGLSVLENLELSAYPQRARKQVRDGMERVFTLFPRLAERQSQLAGTLSVASSRCARLRGRCYPNLYW